MVAAGGAGLNINPRGRPGRAPVLVRLRLNSRNHAVSSVPRKKTREKRTFPLVGRTGAGNEGGKTEGTVRDASELTRPRAVNRVERTSSSTLTLTSYGKNRARVTSRRVAAATAHRAASIFRRARTNTTDTNDPRPTAGLKVRDWRWPRIGRVSVESRRRNRSEVLARGRERLGRFFDADLRRYVNRGKRAVRVSRGERTLRCRDPRNH